MTSYPESVRFLYSLGNEIRTVKLGLERIRELLAALGNPHRSFRSVHVAGTNGKGSVAAMIASSLRAAGYRTGLYTSPHLAEPTERIRVDGKRISEDHFARVFDAVHHAALRMQRLGELEFHPTYFETVTAMGFLAFRELGVEVAVVETGLGGRLDATNVLEPEVAVITRIDYDHEAWLGNSIEAIAGEKAGILKAGRPAVFGPQRPEALEVLEERAAELGIRPVEAASWTVHELELRPDGSRLVLRRGDEEIPIVCPLAGAHQIENVLSAVAALRELGIEAGDIRRGIARTRWPGRLERVREGPEVILDGAHNPGAMRELAAHIRRFYTGRKVWVLYGSMRDKSLDEIAGILAPVADHIVVTQIDSDRALRPEVLQKLFDHGAVEMAPDIEEGLEMVLEAAPEDVVFVTGSLLLVGEVRKRLVG